MTFTLANTITAILFAVGAVALTWWKPYHELGRRAVLGAGLAWVLVWSVEYFIAGRNSFSLQSADLDLAFALDRYLAHFWDGGRFSHALLGGTDVYAMSISTGQLVSLERWLVAAFPPWQANAIHKVLVCAVGLMGTYRMCRVSKRCGRGLALTLAGIFTLSHVRVTEMTWSHGLGFALVPLFVYLVVLRAGRRHYFAGVVTASTLFAISCSPTHSLLSVLAAILVAPVLGMAPRRPGRLVAALAILGLAVAANWHESLFAKALLGNETDRGNVHWSPLEFLFAQSYPLMALAAGAIVLAAASRGPWVRIAVAILLSFGIGALSQTLVNLLPFKALHALNFANMRDGFPAIACLAFALAWTRASASTAKGRFGGGWRQPGLAMVAALAAGMMGEMKSSHVLVWLSQGGQGIITALGRGMAGKPQLTDGSARVLAVPYRLSGNTLAAEGMATFDGIYQLIPHRMTTYWNAIVAPSVIDAESGMQLLDANRFDPKNAAQVDLGKAADLTLLRIANVGYVASFMPLVGKGITPMENYPPVAPLPAGLLARMRVYLDFLRDPTPVRLYALEAPLPKVYASAGVVAMPDGTDGQAFMAAVKANGLQRHPVAMGADLPAQPIPDTIPAIAGYDLIRDGAVVRLVPGAGGVVVLSDQYNRFWRAYADAKPVPTFPVNGVQTAALVPAGTKEVVFRYERPLLREVLFGGRPRREALASRTGGH